MPYQFDMKVTKEFNDFMPLESQKRLGVKQSLDEDRAKLISDQKLWFQRKESFSLFLRENVQRKSARRFSSCFILAHKVRVVESSLYMSQKA